MTDNPLDVVSVPREPTEAMLDAMSDALEADLCVDLVWSAALAAAVDREAVTLSASDRACYEYPGVDQQALRAAFVACAACRKRLAKVTRPHHPITAGDEPQRVNQDQGEP